ncbi:uncharacterized protein B0H18DRAFT_843886, partial [Fomitopsis serialis]|uniref:uncharacterized protein n=1 Tax=Fomitopsis serialis TaxID=139415 RepID=UPI002008666B
RADTLAAYATPATTFLAAVMRSLHHHPSKYAFPLSDNCKALAVLLYDCLGQEDSHSEEEFQRLIHQTLWSSVATSVEGIDSDQWQCPLTCWLAVSSLREDGRFLTAKDYTPVLAKWEYLLRNVYMCQGMIEKDNYPDHLQGAIRTLCQQWLTDDHACPWNTLRDHQRFASSLALQQPAAPKITWSPDMTSVTCQGRTLQISRLHDGLQKLVKSVQQRMQQLSDGHVIPLSVPADLTEDLTDDRVGYSWLTLGQFTPTDLPLLKILLEHPKYSLAHVDNNGEFQWNHPGLQALRRDLSELVSELAVLCFMTPAPPPRGTEFVDTRLSNAQIPRNMYKNYGTWFIHQRTKTSALTESLSWVPTLCPEPVAALVDWYLVLVRPVENIISHVLDDDAARANHREYMWMSNGEQLDSGQFSHILERVTHDYMGCDLSLHYWRHIAVSIMREFIPPSGIVDNFGDKSMNHNTDMARRVYAREVGHLPYLTTDAMLQSRQFGAAWHNVMGLGESPCPVALRLFGYQANTGSGQTAQSNQSLPAQPTFDLAQLSGLVAGAVTRGIESLKVELEDLVRTSVMDGLAAMRSTSGHSAHPIPNLLTPPFSYPPQPNQQHQQPLGHSSDSSIPSPGDQAHEEQASQLMDVDELGSGPTMNATPSLPSTADLESTLSGQTPSPTPRYHDFPARHPEPSHGVVSAKPSVAVIPKAEVLKCLQITLRNPEATFTSDSQYRLISSSLSLDQNVVAILPTGGGKSMCYEVPAVTDDKGLSIVFVPFVAIINDQLRRAAANGIKAARFNSSSPPPDDLQLLFASWE